MAILPDTNHQLLEFAEAHASAWTTNAALIGLSAPQVAAITAAVAAARAAFNAQQAAQEIARGATQSFHASAEAMTALIRTAVLNIKNKAHSAGDPSIYTLAQIPPPAAPAPMGPPESPTDLRAQPRADGTVTLSWKGSTRGHTFFTVWRRDSSTGEDWTSLGATAFRSKTFLDTTVPAGVVGVQYRVLAQRLNFVSDPSPTVAVNFGGAAGRGGVSAGLIGPGTSAARAA